MNCNCIALAINALLLRHIPKSKVGPTTLTGNGVGATAVAAAVCFDFGAIVAGVAVVSTWKHCV